MTYTPLRARWLPNLLAVAIATVLTLAVTVTLYARVPDAGTAPPRAAMPVETAVFEETSGYSREQRFLGLVQAASRSQVGFEVPGAIEEVYVREGARVDAGQALAKLDTQALQSRQQAFESTVDQISAELELARARTERQAPLKTSGAISAQTFDDTRLAEKALVSRLEAAQAQLRSIEIDLEKSTLRAPYPARIGRQLVDKGGVTQPGTPVFTLVSTADREAHIGISVEQAQFIRPGERYALQWRSQTMDVELKAVRGDVNPVSMTIEAIFDLPASVDAFDGEPVSLSIPRGVTDRGGWLPMSALLEGERGVWTVLALRERPDGVVALREVVEVLYVDGARVYVRGSINDGDHVIADGVHRVAPGTRVDVSPQDVTLAQAPR